MDSGLKERLVGAAVLVALGVWLIPWVLDGRAGGPEATEGIADTVELPAPDSMARTQTRTIALDDNGRAGADVPANVPAPAARSESVETPADAAGNATVAVAAAQSPQQDAPAGTAPAEATVAPPKPAQNTAAPAEGWFVQLGSFGDTDNAKRLAARVATFGYQADVSPHRSGGRTLSRVRVGPWSTRDEAAAVASSLAAHGFVAQVVSED